MNFALDHQDVERIAEAVANRLAMTTRKTQWLTRREAAEYLRCSTKQLDGYVYEGAVPVYRPSPRKPLYKACDLDRFVESERRECADG